MNNLPKTGSPLAAAFIDAGRRIKAAIQPVGEAIADGFRQAREQRNCHQPDGNGRIVSPANAVGWRSIAQTPDRIDLRDHGFRFPTLDDLP